MLFRSPRYAGPIGVTGAAAANVAATGADVVIAVGTRLEDFTTGSWTVFAPDARIVAVNAARFDAIKHRATPVVGDAREALAGLSAELRGWSADPEWTQTGVRLRGDLQDFVDERTAEDGVWPPSYAQLVGRVHASALPEDYVLTAAGGLPGELNINWMSTGIATFDCDYGFSCMGYEISGAWGAAFARTQGQVYAMCGDGSYLMANSELVTATMLGTKLIVVLLDNRGFGCINRLQHATGGERFNNLYAFNTRLENEPAIDFAAHARSLGAEACKVASLAELETALAAEIGRAHV